MSEKNFVAYGDAESILTGYANRIKQSPTTFVGTQAQWNALSSSQKAEYELVDITDDSLSPSGHVDWESNGELGAKNLLPFDISHIIRINGGGTWNGLAYTYNGVTYTLLSDGTVRVNGTATAYSLFRIIDANSIFLNPSNDYYITGSPSSSTASTYYVYYSELINGSWVYYSNLGDEDTLFTPNTTATQCVVDIVVRDGQIVDNVIFKPMLRLATDPDTTYQPYSMTNKEMTPYVQAISNPNLLDNPWFTVNQRGQNSYSSTTSIVYSVDRWYLFGGSGTITCTPLSEGINLVADASADGSQLTARLSLPDLTNKNVTLSINLNGTIYSNTANIAQRSSSWERQINITTPEGVTYELWNAPSSDANVSGTCSITVPKDGNTYTIKAVKLELGSVSTLAMDTAPNYVSELLKCQRYFVRYKPTNAFAWIGFGIGQNSATDLQAMMEIPVPMRIKPSISFNKVRLWNHTYAADVSSINVSEQCQNKLYLYITPDSSTVIPGAAPVVIWLNHNYGDYIDISADL